MFQFQKYIQPIFFILCALFLNNKAWGFASKDIPFYSNDTHHQLTSNALEDVIRSGTYPDIQMYAQLILSGSSTEGISGPGAHKSIDNLITYWSGNEGNWQQDVTTQYEKMNFSAAYTELGYVIHLLEDAQVPSVRVSGLKIEL